MPENYVAMPGYRDYTVGGPESKLALKKGLANGVWFVPFVERKTMKELMKRDDYHATRDTAILFGIIASTALAAYYFWTVGSYGYFAMTFWIYCTFYTSSADSRWHECGHSTAFKSKWKNDLLYYVSSSMVFREPHVWRFSHARHHTDTDIVGRDPEIDGRPLDMWNLFLAFFNYQGICGEAGKIWGHAKGKMSEEETSFVPYSEYKAVYRTARIWLAFYALVIVASFAIRSPLPAMYIFLPYSFGAWHFVLTGVFQHAGLQHDVLDHRLNTRTCHINFVSSFIYWNMQYHLEHHTFPMVPYYNLHKLHEVVKDQFPPAYNGMLEVYREMIPALKKQCLDPDYYIDRSHLVPAALAVTTSGKAAGMTPDKNGWVAAADIDDVKPGDVARFDVGPRTYALYHAEDDGLFYATAGECTHGAGILSDGLITDNMIECPKHNGCFDFKTGQPLRLPVKLPIATYPVRREGNVVYVNVEGGANVQVDFNTQSERVPKVQAPVMDAWGGVAHMEPLLSA